MSRYGGGKINTRSRKLSIKIQILDKINFTSEIKFETHQVDCLLTFVTASNDKVKVKIFMCFRDF